MTNLIIMIGIPGAGKSTYIKENYPFAKIESRDAVRFSIVKEDEEYFSKEDEVFRTWTDNIKIDIANNVPTVVADATHLNATSRRKLINALRGFLNEVEITGLVINTPLDTCLAQNEFRVGTRGYVPPSAIRNMAKSFRIPNKATEQYFNDIIIVER